MVLLENLGLQLQVLVDGQTADEYLPPAQQNIGTERLDSQPYICHRYIESFANSHFSISFEAVGANGCLKEWIEADQNNAINFRIKLDGQSVGGRVIDQELRKRICSEFFDLENRTRQYFQFASISPIEDATKELESEHREKSKESGTIEILAHRLIQTETLKLNKIQSKRKASTSGTKACGLAQGDEIALAEKALKGRALVHGAWSTMIPRVSQSYLLEHVGGRISDEETTSMLISLSLAPARRWNPTATTGSVKWEWVDPVETSFAILRFMYRSEDALKQELIIPRAPSPESSPSPKPRTVDDLSPKDIRRLAQERLSDLQNRKRAAHVKKEEDEIQQHARPLKYIHLPSGRQAIDLTEDD